MTPTEQRIAIAEHLGFTNAIIGKVGMVGKTLTNLDWVQIPDYLNDLNAMHAAEETLSVTLKGEFVNILSHITGDNYWASIHSAAEWRAQAFLRTIGKWKD